MNGHPSMITSLQLSIAVKYHVQLSYQAGCGFPEITQPVSKARQPKLYLDNPPFLRLPVIQLPYLQLHCSTISTCAAIRRYATSHDIW